MDAVAAAGGAVKLVNAPVTKGSGCGFGVRCDDYELCRRTLNYGHYAHLQQVYSYDGSEYKSLYNVEN